MDELLDGLNSEQEHAVRHGVGPLLVVAGAGTGKTQVITRRIARLIKSGEAKPTEILALTFTEKAAQEMQDRLMGLIGWEAMSVPARTFNAFGAELIMNYAHHIGRSIRGGLINDTQKSLLLKQRIPELSLHYYGMQQDIYEFAERIVGYIGRLQNRGISATQYRTFVGTLSSESDDWSAGDITEQSDLALLYETYEALKLETQTYDYYDQLAIPLAILEDRPNLIERLRQRYQYVLVDEYQDTSPMQDALLKLLVPSGGNIFAVGDDDQAIYAFRGAQIGNIMAFNDYFGVTETLALVENYRSGQAILDAAYRLIQHNNPERLEAMLGIDKRLHAQTDEAQVSFRLYETTVDEEAAIVDGLEKRLQQLNVKPSSLAVLARSNAVLRRFAKALRERGLPYTISTTISVFEQREMISLWSLMEWICHRASDDAISAVIMGPFVGWSAAQLRYVVQRCRDEVISLEAALRAEAELGNQLAAVLIQQLDGWRELAATETVSRCVYRLVFDYGLAERLQARGADSRTLRVFDDLRRFLEQLQDYESTQVLLSIGDLGLATYMNQFPRPPELETRETEGDSQGINLLTVHASKGLEFDTVYLAGLTARSWSAQSSMGLEVPQELVPDASTDDDMHEQRRLMYVAVTRAKSELYVSAATQTTSGGNQSVSPMLHELAGDLAVESIITEEKSSNSLLRLQRFYPLQTQLPDTLPFERDSGWIELGVGDLERFSNHPHDFYLQNVLGIVRPFGPQLGFGTAVHGAIQALYEARLQGYSITADEITLRLDELWNNRGYETEAQALAAHAKARATVLAFRAREEASPLAVESTELPVVLEIEEAKLRLRGRIDATIRHPDGLEIRDFKTGTMNDPEKLLDRTKKSFQLRTYALAIEALTGTTPALVTLDYVVTELVASTTLTPRVLANHRDKLVKLAASLRAREFDPGTPSAFNPSAAFRYYGSESDEDSMTVEEAI